MKYWKKLIVLAGVFVSAFASIAGSFDDFFSAIRRDDESAVVQLLFRGFDPNTLDERGEHALLVAIRADAWQVANYLLDQPLLKVETRNALGESPLMLAALKGQVALVNRLIQRKAEVNKPGWAPLHYAATHAGPQSLEVVRRLIEHHAYIDAESPNKTTPLMMAARYGTPDVVKLLLEEGADPTLKNEQGLTAHDFAQAARRKEAAELILANLQARTATGRW